MKSHKLLLPMFIFFLMSMGYHEALQAQDIRTSLFAAADKALEQAGLVKADLLSPHNYDEGMKRYRDAEQALQRGDNLDKIRKKLEEAVAYFNKGNEATKLGEVTFSSVLSARDDARDAEASQFASEQWNAAENEFNGAARELEDGDAKNGKKKGTKAEALYREAELIAIKSNILESTRSLLEEADNKNVDDQAPQTLEKAKQLVQKTEEALENSRYDTDVARNLAKQADYEARHALYLHTYIEDLDRQRKSREDVILMAEEPLKRVADQLLISAELDKGYDRVANTIIEQINVLNDSLNTQHQEIESLTQEYANLESENAGLRTKLESLTNERTEISQRVEAMNRFRERFSTVDNLFSKEEAQVMRDQNDAIIRLTGLNFDVGSSVIKPEHFGLLNKVKQAIDTFPGCNIVIEGHTDSQGSDEVNLNLSQDRADAVMSYLLANMNIEPLRIEAKGYGENRPVANNETEQGRKLNRRIDVIIQPKSL